MMVAASIEQYTYVYARILNSKNKYNDHDFVSAHLIFKEYNEIAITMMSIVSSVFLFINLICFLFLIELCCFQFISFFYK